MPLPALGKRICRSIHWITDTSSLPHDMLLKGRRLSDLTKTAYQTFNPSTVSAQLPTAKQASLSHVEYNVILNMILSNLDLRTIVPGLQLIFKLYDLWPVNYSAILQGVYIGPFSSRHCNKYTSKRIRHPVWGYPNQSFIRVIFRRRRKQKKNHNGGFDSIHCACREEAESSAHLPVPLRRLQPELPSANRKRLLQRLISQEDPIWTSAAAHCLHGRVFREEDGFRVAGSFSWHEQRSISSLPSSNCRVGFLRQKLWPHQEFRRFLQSPPSEVIWSHCTTKQLQVFRSDWSIPSFVLLYLKINQRPTRRLL